MLRSFGIDRGQPTAHLVSIAQSEVELPSVREPHEVAASEELLELLAWAVEESWLAEKDAALPTARYFGDQTGRDGVATDRQLGAARAEPAHGHPSSSSCL
ncbi:hypothetical protein [Amycolatopsis samaneae]|uniref:Uncharacterized protein n=1 Tax=Amycolatopsis samaneae TaxID=664691 RepID=A0ABW5GPA9_9PSEU